MVMYIMLYFMFLSEYASCFLFVCVAWLNLASKVQYHTLAPDIS
jgi:hypothetical protein